MEEMSHEHEQRSDDWYASRVGRVTASRIAAVLSGGKGLTRRAYRDQLVAERLTGRYVQSYQSAKMTWGIDTEPAARAYYAQILGKEIEKTGGQSHPRLVAGASPDGLLDPDGLLEIKCPDTVTHVGWMIDGEVPATYFGQMQFQLACYPDRKWNQFISFDPRLPESSRLFIAPKLYRDEKWIRNCEAEVVRFLAEVDEMVGRLTGPRRNEPMLLPNESESEIIEILKASLAGNRDH